MDNVQFENVDILNLPAAPRFDCVVSIDNLEHIDDDVGALRRIFASMLPGGKLICHVPAYERIWLFRGRKPNFDVPGHVRPGYRPEELRAKLTAAGFQIRELKFTYGYLETVSNNVSYLITGAAQKNQAIYAAAFPCLNFVAWLGRHQDPKDCGAGVLAVAVKPGV
jgi:hypothetical protein